MKTLRTIAGWLAALLFLTAAFSGRALAAGAPVTAVLTGGEAVTFPEGWPVPPEITAPSAIVADADTGAILYAKDPDRTCDPGGTAKLMTALLTLEDLPLTEVITFSNKAIQSLPAGATHVAIKRDEQLSVRDCLYGLLLPGANEIAFMLAERIAGDAGSFAVKMNSRAAELGCYNSQFSGPTGLQVEPAVTTAYDLLLLFEACLAEPAFTPIDGASSYTIQPTNKTGDSRPMANAFLYCRRGSDYYDARVTAGRIGSGADGGVSLVACAGDGTRRVIVVLTGATYEAAYGEGRILIDFALNSFVNVDASQLENRFLATGDAGNILGLPRPPAGAQSVPEYTYLTMPARGDETVFAPTLREVASGTRVIYTYEGVPAGTALLRSSAANYQAEYRHLAASETLPIRFVSLWIPVLAGAGLLMVILLVVLLVQRHKRRGRFSMR